MSSKNITVISTLIKYDPINYYIMSKEQKEQLRRDRSYKKLINTLYYIKPVNAFYSYTKNYKY